MHSVSDFISVKKVMWARIALDINTVQTVLASIIRYPFVSQIQSKFFYLAGSISLSCIRPKFYSWDRGVTEIDEGISHVRHFHQHVMHELIFTEFTES